MLSLSGGGSPTPLTGLEEERESHVYSFALANRPPLGTKPNSKTSLRPGGQKKEAVSMLTRLPHLGP